MADGLEEEQNQGRGFKACIVLIVDDQDQWAAVCDGVELEGLKKFLQFARDDAVLGGKGFAVMVPKEPLLAARE